MRATFQFDSQSAMSSASSGAGGLIVSRLVTRTCIALSSRQRKRGDGGPSPLILFLAWPDTGSRDGAPVLMVRIRLLRCVGHWVDRHVGAAIGFGLKCY